MEHFRNFNQPQKKYLFRDRQCIGRTCWSPGLVRTPRASSLGCCLVSASEDGCPLPIPQAKDDLVNERREKGWVVA